ncbi:MAG: MSCRAMM family protein [Pseudonocardia sp.]
MSEQGLAARALAGARSLVGSRRAVTEVDGPGQGPERPLRTVADLVRHRAERAAATPPEPVAATVPAAAPLPVARPTLAVPVRRTAAPPPPPADLDPDPAIPADPGLAADAATAEATAAGIAADAATAAEADTGPIPVTLAPATGTATPAGPSGAGPEPAVALAPAAPAPAAPAPAPAAPASTAPATAEPEPARPAAVPTLLSDAELMAALGEEDEPAEPEPPVVVMTTSRPASPMSPNAPGGIAVRTDALAPPWVRAALMGAEPRSSATPERAAASRALRRTFGVPQDPGPVALRGVGADGGVAVLSRARPVATAPVRIVGAPVPVRFRVVRRDATVVAGAEVALVDRAGVTVADAVADRDGRGRFVVQQPGPYMLVGAAPGYQPGAVTVAAVAGRVDVDVLLVRSASVSGAVRLDGEVVAGAQLTLVQDGEVVDMVAADGSGRFRLTELTGGEYALAVAAQACPPAVLVLVVPEEADLAYDVDLASPRPAP